MEKIKKSILGCRNQNKWGSFGVISSEVKSIFAKIMASSDCGIYKGMEAGLGRDIRMELPAAIRVPVTYQNK